MGLFSSKPALQLPPTTNIHVSDELRSSLPDPGHYLLSLYPAEVRDTVAAELDRVRFPNGGYDMGGVESNKKAGPLYLLSWIKSSDWIAVQVWATLVGLSRGEKRDIGKTVEVLCREQGIPAAASWVLAARSGSGRDTPKLAHLADQLSSTYATNIGNITNGMMIDSIKKWRR